MHSASFHRMARDGPGVVCLHANPGTLAPWRSLSERLAPDWRVVTPQAYGPPRGPGRPADPAPTLADELEALAPVFDAAGERFHLVGHSWGGALALRAALAFPDRVESVAVYEPPLFALLRADDAWHPDLERLAEVVRAGAEALARGEPEAAARSFIDFWAQPGAFDAMPPGRRAQILSTIECIGSWWRVLHEDPTPLSTFARLRAPVLLMTGRDTRAAARSVAEALVAALPGIQVVRFDGLGHMGPMTHPERVLPVIESFLSTRRAARMAQGPEGGDPGRPDPSEFALVSHWAHDAASAAGGVLAGRAAIPPRPSSDPGDCQEALFASPPV